VESVGYDNIVEQVYKALAENFDAFASACINLETKKLLETIREEVK